ncbi:DNA polymerase/3'-5' exonuclease PolX [candidate division KSB1 bacterium]|nr:DNA polymerase/3'-5' exonuclease PolX [candidate division KSB1 bacterium]
MKNIEISTLLERMADILEFKGEVIFKINAYRKASRILRETPQDIEKLAAEKRLSELPGIGDAIQEKILEFLSSGTVSAFERLLDTVPKELFELLSIPSYGPKTAALAYRELGVETVADLKKTIENGSLRALPGMGDKKIENIRKGIELRDTAATRLSIGIALPVAEEIIEYLKEKGGDRIARISPAGSLRRFCETVHDIDIVVETEDGAGLIELFTAMPRVTRVLGAGETKASVMLDDRYQIDLRAVAEGSFGAAQLYFTGSKAHNVHLREMARKKNYKINEYGVFEGEKKIAGAEEKELYSFLGMEWIPPELREDRGEIEVAMEKKLPRLVRLEDIQADLHIHTNQSDGQLPLEEMVEAVRARGYRYMAICDHSGGAFYANGLSPDRLLRSIEKIRQLNEKLSDFTILAGAEVDILADGKLDYDDNLLKQLDFAVASIHSAFKSDPTGRTCAAMSNPYVDVIGHPTGRLISRRQGFVLDIDKVIQTAVETGTALEVNSFWDRLDLKDSHVKAAIDAGAVISINTDAHHPPHLEMMVLGVGTARRGWATADRVINTYPLERLKKWQKRNR